METDKGIGSLTLLIYSTPTKPPKSTFTIRASNPPAIIWFRSKGCSFHRGDNIASPIEFSNAWPSKVPTNLSPKIPVNVPKCLCAEDLCDPRSGPAWTGRVGKFGNLQPSSLNTQVSNKSAETLGYQDVQYCREKSGGWRFQRISQTLKLKLRTSCQFAVVEITIIGNFQPNDSEHSIEALEFLS